MPRPLTKKTELQCLEVIKNLEIGKNRVSIVLKLYLTSTLED